MKVVIVYKEESDHARPVLDFVRDFTRQTGRELETIDPESPDGAQFCRTYDIVEYPSVIAISDDGCTTEFMERLTAPAHKRDKLL